METEITTNNLLCMHQLPNVLGFTFGVIQMGLYKLYRNATPRVLPANDDAKEEAMSVDDSTFEVPGEHVAPANDVQLNDEQV